MIIGINGKIGSGKDTVGRAIQYLTLEGANNYAFGSAGGHSFETYMKNVPYQHPMNTWEVKRFADKLKEMVAMFLDLPREDLEKQEVKDRLLPDEWQLYEVYGDPTEDYPELTTCTSIEEANRICKELHSFDNGKYFHKQTKRTIRWFLQQFGTEAVRNNIHQNAWALALFSEYKGSFKKGLHFPNWIITDLRFPNEMDIIKKYNGVTIRVTRPGTDVGSTHASEISLDDSKFDYEIHNDGTLEDLLEKVRQTVKTITIL